MLLLTTMLMTSYSWRTVPRPRELLVATDWASASKTPSEVVWSAPSALNASETIEVREQCGPLGVWRSLYCTGDAGNPTDADVQQSVTRMRLGKGCSASAVPSEYLLSMAALALASLHLRRAASQAPRFLFLGLGAGSLPMLLAKLVPDADLHAVELDPTVVEAAHSSMGLDRTRVRCEVGDAQQWLRRRAEATTSATGEARSTDEPLTSRFDAIFVDVFASDGLTPPAFYSDQCLQDMRRALVPGGCVVANCFHGQAESDRALSEISAGLRRAFGSGSCCLIPVFLYSGNAILAAERADQGASTLLSQADALPAAARREGWRRGARFDAARRLQEVYPF